MYVVDYTRRMHVVEYTRLNTVINDLHYELFSRDIQAFKCILKRQFIFSIIV